MTNEMNDAEAQLMHIETMRNAADLARDTAEKSWYACALPIGLKREKAFQIYENIRTATRVYT